MTTLMHCFSDLLAHELIRHGLKISAWIRLDGKSNANLGIFEDLSKELYFIQGYMLIDMVRNNNLDPEYIILFSHYEEHCDNVFSSFLQCRARRFQRSLVRNEFVFYEYAFFTFFQRCYHLIKKRRLKCFVFAYVSHKGVDVILYYLGQLMGWDILLHVQMPATKSGYYTILSEIEGALVCSCALPKASLLIDARSSMQMPFYMREYEKKYLNYFWYPVENFLKFIIILLIVKFYSLWCAWLYNICYAARHFGFFLRYTSSAIGREKIEDIISQKEYICPLLRLGPEMVIYMLGRKYREQALFIMRLREKIPDNIMICVKENPAKTTYGWDGSFFRSILMLYNVCYIREDIDTFLLMKNAYAVATILGAAGWGALRPGKSVIVGGRAWYSCLLGAFDIDTFSCRDLASFKAKTNMLYTAADDMIRYFRCGILANFQFYKKSLPEFDETENVQRIAEGLIEYLSISGGNR